MHCASKDLRRAEKGVEIEDSSTYYLKFLVLPQMWLGFFLGGWGEAGGRCHASSGPYYLYLWGIALSISFLELEIWGKGKTIQTETMGSSDPALNPPFFFQTPEHEGRYYECDVLPFMEIGSVAHKYYLLNIRLPVNEKKKINVGIGEIKDIRLVVSDSDWSR